MPIYSYCCEECGFAQEVLQKLSDSQLTECPACGKSSFKKQLTAAAITGGDSFSPSGPACPHRGSCMGGPCG